MTDFDKTEGGIYVPAEKPESEPTADSEQPEYPVKKGWTFSKCDDRYYQSDDVEFRKQAIEVLHIAIDPGGGRVWLPGQKERRNRMMSLLNELSVELVGGIPEVSEQFT